MRRSVMIAALLAMMAVGTAWAQGHKPAEQVVRGTGQAAVANGDLAGAERAARQAAMRDAIEKVLGAFVKADSLTQDQALVYDRIVTKTGGYAVLKQVVTNAPDGDIYNFVADYTVSAVPLVQQLRAAGILREWRVMVVIPEWHIQAPIPDPAAETEFINQFVKAGYKVIDQKRYAQLRQEQASRLKDPNVAAEIARKMGADIVITGEAFSSRVPGDIAGFVSCRARVEVRALLADTAEIISADATEGPGADLTEPVAAKKALQNTAKKLAPQFVADITLLPASDTRKIQIEVSGIRFGAATKFERALATIPGVNKVHRESFDEGVLVLDVDSDVASSDALAEALEESEALKPFGIAVNAVSKTRIRATVK